jgi:hypothetical protein
MGAPQSMKIVGCPLSTETVSHSMFCHFEGIREILYNIKIYKIPHGVYPEQHNEDSSLALMTQRRIRNDNMLYYDTVPPGKMVRVRGYAQSVF